MNILFSLSVYIVTICAATSSFPSTTCWPLCGRVPIGTVSCNMSRCGSCLFNDLPIDNTYGPRTQGNSGNRYDWHRGIDIKTDINSSLFAVTSGEVEDIKTSSSDGISIQLQHFRSNIRGNCSCGCYFSRYLHATASVVSVGDWIETGDLIGYSGASSSGNAHLHFEIRSAKADDPKSDWQRECVSPLRVLSYCPMDDDAAYFTRVQLIKWNKISVTSSRKDIVKVELVLKNTNGDVIASSVSNQYGYDVNPTFLDIEAFTYQYTHKDSSSASWESFGLGGSRQCPYYEQHEAQYDAHVHLDRQSASNQSVGEFNGLMVFPYDEKDDLWGMVVTFVGIDGSVESSVECTVVNVYAAEFGTLNNQIVNSTSFGNCDVISSTQTVATDTMFYDTTDTSPSDGSSRILSNRMNCIVLLIICYILN
eukprot:223167_1